jgi:HTH-type transcriptional regulator/antitoxin HigA
VEQMSNKPYKKFPREMDESWRPGWTSPPGDTLRELIEMRGWTQALLAREIGWSLKHVNRVVQGHETISVDFAMALESLDFGSAEFWMRREGDYRVGIARAALAPSATGGDS